MSFIHVDQDMGQEDGSCEEESEILDTIKCTGFLA